MASRRPWAGVLLGGGIVLVTAIVFVVAQVSGLAEVGGAAELPDILEERGTVVLVGGSDLAALAGDGTTIVASRDLSEVDAALRGTDEEALVSALRRAEATGVLVDGRATASGVGPERSVGARLHAYDAMDRLRALYLAPAAAFYVLRDDSRTLSPAIERAVADVARGIVGGARPPRLSSFPEVLRRFESVEVMVMLRDRRRARLWRSARGSSIASSLLTAASVARQRWNEREASMGGPLSALLPTFDVEVSLLEEDGTVGDRSPTFVRRVFTRRHGVAYQQKSSWRYLLPEATWEDDRSAVDAYAQLFTEHAIDADSLDRDDLRLYRLLATTLARSPAPSRPSSSPPDEAPDGSPPVPDDEGGDESP